MNRARIFVLILAFFAQVLSGGTASQAAPPREIIDLGGGITLELSSIPPGIFQMGSDHCTPLEQPVRPVKISQAFYLGIHEVTQAQYRQIMSTNPSFFAAAKNQEASDYANADAHPVEQVSWFDCVRFCNLLSMNQKLTPCYMNKSRGTIIADNDAVTCDWTANGYRLPTEAEWEYACRAGTTTRYYWGEAMSSRAIKQYAWYVDNALETAWTKPHAPRPGTQPVGTKLPNAFGLFDMTGNVWEWCWDWYGGYDTRAQLDPKGSRGFCRVARGGSWSSFSFLLPSAYRSGTEPNCRPIDQGFRILRAIP
jgi:formylglycine-generating enzyme required for sulfatase activity